jgi:cbb3-type cytochrome oxidase subunit 3
VWLLAIIVFFIAMPRVIKFRKNRKGSFRSE